MSSRGDAADGDGERGRSTVSLGEVAPAGSRHRGRRSAVAIVGGRVVAGTADGEVIAFDDEGLDEVWRQRVGAGQRQGDDGRPAVVALVGFRDAVLVGTRGREGRVALLDADTGEVRWSYDAAAEVGEPQKDTRFFLPFAASLATDGDRAYAAVRRYERGRDGERRFESVVYAFDPDGSIVWEYRADASPISLATDADEPSAGADRVTSADRIAVAYNRCTGDHQSGLVVLDAETGTERWSWDPEVPEDHPTNDPQRRVGDVAFLGEGVVAASHADYQGYRVGADGEHWAVDLATPVEREGETLYAYPNHVHASGEGVVFVTGNTYAREGRETDGRHPREHTAVGLEGDGQERWTAEVGGFASGVGTDGNRIAVPVAQHFRERTPDAHALHVLDTREGPLWTHDAGGVVTAAAVQGDRVAAVEEPVVYHDEGTERGAYRLHVV